MERPGIEKIPVEVFGDAGEASVAVARGIAALIREKEREGRKCVLGLATGSTPVGVYAELVRMCAAGEVSFRNVVTFNLDEYFPMGREELQSYWRFMQEHLFAHVDIEAENVHVPDGTIALGKVGAYCRRYEEMIAEAGGLDLQLLGIGRTGHIGFNEPGSGRESRTRLITLDRVTRLDAAADFFGEEFVPRRAITMGVGTILSARQVVLMAFGEHKAGVVRQAVEGPVTSSVAASFLQEHPHARVVVDEAAAAELTRFKTPWLVEGTETGRHGDKETRRQADGGLVWDDMLTRKAVIWLAREVGKPILKLTDEDYNEHHLQDLAAARESAYDVNIDVFRSLQETITGWPGGKPASEKRPGDIARATDAVFPKRIVIFSPHPDDDVISMGGTLIRLVDQGHEVHVAYQTSGNIAVFDADAIRFADFAAEYNRLFGIGAADAKRVEEHIEAFLRRKKPGQVDSPEVQSIKGLIRRGEARAAGRSCGVPVERLHFMDLPFYETGRVKKKPLGEEDVRLTVELLEKIRPQQIYAAGDLSDPHGTHRVCLAAVLEAVRRIRARDGKGWIAQCEVWLYRGAWQEWEPEKIEMAVPLSPEELLRKRMAIFKHQSQKDRAMFPGLDQREFWQRAEDRNRATAAMYDKLGLAEYEAMEGFVRWRGE
ncbi:MAG TPA: glucosamine-6-phosphate deaminase [Phycisphaerae bacterium]|nr:glucosamine-6-phosphate deaminase [Phycisphaerae bacterium]